MLSWDKDDILSGTRNILIKFFFFFHSRRMLQELAHEIAILFKNEVDAVLALVDQGSEMAKKVRDGV